jgi:hypothetical protein
MSFVKSTTYEGEHIQMLLAAGEFTGEIAVHRIDVISFGEVATIVTEQTNDDNDDGYPDGEWKTWNNTFDTPEQAMKYAGVCRVGVSGVVVTVTFNGKEVRR